jgi:hypothetical protein
MSAQVLVQLVVMNVTVNAIRVRIRASTLSLFESHLDGRAVETLLVGLAASFAEPARVAARAVHVLPAEVEPAHALPTPLRTASATG